MYYSCVGGIEISFRAFSAQLIHVSLFLFNYLWYWCTILLLFDHQEFSLHGWRLGLLFGTSSRPVGSNSWYDQIQSAVSLTLAVTHPFKGVCSRYHFRDDRTGLHAYPRLILPRILLLQYTFLKMSASWHYDLFPWWRNMLMLQPGPLPFHAHATALSMVSTLM